MPQCKAKTKTGARCLHKTKESSYCAQHCGRKRSSKSMSHRRGHLSSYNKFVKANIHKMSGSPTQRMKAVAKLWHSSH